MTYNTTFHPESFLSILPETDPISASETAALRGCSLNTAKNALEELQKMGNGRWTVKSKNLGRAVLWWKEKKLTEGEIRKREIAELKRLMEKYPEIVRSFYTSF